MQGLVGKGHGLVLDEICVLAQFWQLDIKPEVLRATNSAVSDILGQTCVLVYVLSSCVAYERRISGKSPVPYL